MVVVVIVIVHSSHKLKIDGSLKGPTIIIVLVIDIIVVPYSNPVVAFLLLPPISPA